MEECLGVAERPCTKVVPTTGPALTAWQPTQHLYGWGHLYLTQLDMANADYSLVRNVQESISARVPQ